MKPTQRVKNTHPPFALSDFAKQNSIERVRWFGRLKWLYILSFIESFCFPLPIDPVLALHVSHKKEQAYRIAGITTLLSVAGGLTGYAIGALLWDTLGTSVISLVLSPRNFDWARALFAKHERMAVLIGAFTPIPYKAISLSAGFCHLPLGPFALYSLIGRGARFFLVAFVIRRWGEQMRLFVDRFFTQVLVFACIAVAALVFFLKR